MRSCFFLIFGILILLFLGCEKKERQTIPAFYHWQTNFDLSPSENTFLDSMNVQKLYVKFFDVDWDFNQADAFPQAIVQFDDVEKDFHIIPTIFITNRTLIQLPSNSIPDLAQKIVYKIKTLAISEIQEIQLDCDWSPSTEKKYFQLLTAIRQNIDVTLSATIRLHQVKFAEATGVPPVDKGMLMFYNMDEVGQLETQNSILDLEIAQQYLHNFNKYPIPLDVALPLFSWTCLLYTSPSPRDQRGSRMPSSA